MTESLAFCQATTTGRWLGCVLIIFLLVGLSASARCETALEQASAKIMGDLASQKTLAEDNVQILSALDHDDERALQRGAALYAIARSKFINVIEQLKHAFRHDAPLDTSGAFKEDLADAVSARVAFTNYVDSRNPPRTSAGDSEETRAAATEAIQAAAELVRQLLEAIRLALASVRQAGNDIAEQLDAYKWQSFNEILL